MEVDSDQTPPPEIDLKTQADNFKNQGNQAYGSKDYNLAVAYYTKAINLVPTEATYLSNRAAAHLNRGGYLEAAEDARQATVLDPKFMKAYLRGGKAYFSLGDTANALEMYGGALLLDPRNDEALEARKAVELAEKRRERGLALLKEGQVTRGAQLIDAAIRDMPGSYDLRLAQIEIKLLNKELDEAMVLSTNLLKESGGGSNKLVQLRSKILYEQGNFPSAIKHLQQVLTNDPDNSECASLIKLVRKMERRKGEGNDAFTNSQWDEAIKAYSDCLEFDPNNKIFNSLIYCNRAAVYNKQRKFAEAVSDCDHSIDLNPLNTKAYLRRAQNNVLINEIESIEAAIRDYEHLQRTMDDTRDIEKSLRDAKTALKQAKRKDYYKILGVPVRVLL
jgi:DnaJ family protein C protein 7